MYIGGSLWQSFDGYAAAAGERTVSLPLTGEGPFTFELRNRGDRHPASSGSRLRFKTLVIPAHELRWTFTPSGGPGGQHANRANTRAEVRFDVVGSGALTTSQRERLLERLGPVVAGVADDERSQARNRVLAAFYLIMCSADYLVQR